MNNKYSEDHERLINEKLMLRSKWQNIVFYWYLMFIWLLHINLR